MKQLLNDLPLARWMRGLWRAFRGGADSRRHDGGGPPPDDGRGGPGSRLSCIFVPHPDLEIALRTVRGATAHGNFHVEFTRDRQVGVVIGEVTVADSSDASVTEGVRRSAVSLLEIGSVERLFSELVNHPPRQRGNPHVGLLAVLAESDKDEIHVYNAGHAPVLLFTGDDLEYAAATAPPLGMTEGAAVTPQTFAFQAYDTFFTCSDGFFKVRAPGGESRTLDELEAMVHRAAADTLSEWADGIIAAARAAGTVTDDLTMVVMRRRPEKSRTTFRSRLPNRTSDR